MPRARRAEAKRWLGGLVERLQDGGRRGGRSSSNLESYRCESVGDIACPLWQPGPEWTRARAIFLMRSPVRERLRFWSNLMSVLSPPWV